MFLDNDIGINSATSLATPEFQAIILSGYGSRMYPITEESNLPKALLPIANKPMIYYSLQWLEKSNITGNVSAEY